MIAGDSGSGPAPLPRQWPVWWVVAHVVGPSMSPTLRHGDRLLVRRLRAGAATPPGAVVVARFRSGPDRLVIKRVRRTVDGGVWVEGDNSLVTDDSRSYGVADAVGRVVLRLWPRPGRLAGPPGG